MEVNATREATVIVLDLRAADQAPSTYDELIKSHNHSEATQGVLRPWNLLIIDQVKTFLAHHGLYESILNSKARPKLIILLEGELFSTDTSEPILSLPLVFQDHRSQVRLFAVTDRVGCEWAPGEPLPNGIAYWKKDVEGLTTVDVLTEPLANEDIFNSIFFATSVGGYDAWSIGTKQVWFGRLPAKATADSLYETGQALVGDDGDACLLPRIADWDIPPELCGTATEEDVLLNQEGSLLETFVAIRKQVNSEKLNFGITGRMNSIKRVAIFSDHHERVLNQLIEKSQRVDESVKDLVGSIDAGDGFNEDENRRFDQLGIQHKRKDDYRSKYRDIATQLNDRIVDGVRDWIRTGHSIAPLIITVEDTIAKVSPMPKETIVEMIETKSLLPAIEGLKSAIGRIPKGNVMRLGRSVARLIRPMWARFVLAILYSWLLVTGIFESFDQGRTSGFLRVPESVRATAANVVVIAAILLTIFVVVCGVCFSIADSKIRRWGKSAGLEVLEKAASVQQEALEKVTLNEWVLSKTRRKTAKSLGHLSVTLRGMSEVIRNMLINRHAELSKTASEAVSPNPMVRRDLNDVSAAGTFMQLDQVIAILRTDVSTIIDQILSLRIHEFKGIGGVSVPDEINTAVQLKIEKYVEHLMNAGPLSLEVALSRESAILRKTLIETYWKNVSVVGSSVQESAMTEKGRAFIQFVNSEDLIKLDQRSEMSVFVRFAPEPSRDEIHQAAATSEMDIIYTDTTSCAGILRATGFRSSLVEAQIAEN